MKSWYLIRPGVIELRDVDIPSPSNSEILIRIKTALTCGTDLKAFKRGHPLIPMPGPFGHEFSGIVEEVGGMVSGFKKGDNIMAVHTAPCNKCDYCKRGAFNLCDNLMKEKILGAFSEYILLPKHIVQQNTFKKPEEISFQSASFLEPLSCVIHGMSGLNINPDTTVAIVGYGAIALLHLLVLKSVGASVIVVGRDKGKLKRATNLGADDVVPLTDRICGLNADIVFECTGNLEVWEKSTDLVRKGGVIILFGGCPKGTSVRFDTYRLHYDEITLKGSFHYNPEDVKKAFNLLRKGLQVERLITDIFRLDELDKVFRLLSEGKGIKYLIET